LKNIHHFNYDIEMIRYELLEVAKKLTKTMNICNDTLNIPETRHGINFDIYIYWVDASAGPRVSSAQWSVLRH
jgi:hypothetical protein